MSFRRSSGSVARRPPGDSVWMRIISARLRVRTSQLPWLVGGGFVAIALTCQGFATSAQADPANPTPIYSFEQIPFDQGPRASGEIERLPGDQAGGHPDVLTNANFGNSRNGNADVKNLIFNNPAGVVGNPHALPQCARAEFGSNDCPSDSQVGLQADGNGLVPIFNLEPPPRDSWTDRIQCAFSTHLYL